MHGGGADRTAEAARFGIGGKGRCGLYKCLQSGGGTMDDKVWRGDERDDRESSPQTGTRLIGRRKGRRPEGRRQEEHGRDVGDVRKSKVSEGNEVARSEGGRRAR